MCRSAAGGRWQCGRDRRARATDRAPLRLSAPGAAGTETNLEPGKAFQTGFTHLFPLLQEGDLVLTIEGDNTSRLELVKQMLTRMGEGYQVIFASPYLYGGAIVNTSAFRVFLSAVANLFVKEMLGLHGLAHRQFVFPSLPRRSAPDPATLLRAGHRRARRVRVHGRDGDEDGLLRPFDFRSADGAGCQSPRGQEPHENSADDSRLLHALVSQARLAKTGGGKMTHPRNFAVIGVGGYIAPRHLQAIRDTGHRLVAAVDPKDSVGILDRYSFDVRFFTEVERFDRHLEKLRRAGSAERVHYALDLLPNYLHDAHCRLALRVRADAICEKPLVINPWNLDALAEIEAETGRRIYTILQLRVHPALLALKAQLEQESAGTMHDVVLTYITSRGNWYHVSWKGQPEKSGGIATNIGIHFFDLLLWLFGPAQAVKVFQADSRRMSGWLQLERARVRWFLSVERDDLPPQARQAGTAPPSAASP